MATTGREARRRKILERGSDRLALITGRIHNLPSSPLSDAVSHPQLQDSLHQFSSTPLESYPSEIHDEDEPSFICTDNANTNAQTRINPRLFESDSRIESLAGSPTLGKSTPTSNRKIFDSSQISFAIKDSVDIRLFCSAMIAILVILSIAGFPVIGAGFMENYMLSRPILLIVVTDLTIVIMKLVRKEPVRIGIGRESVDSDDRYGWAVRLSKVLEGGLVLYRIVVCLWLDFSVYLVVLICGLSVMPSTTAQGDV